jgi:hypothetical protein
MFSTLASDTPACMGRTMVVCSTNLSAPDLSATAIILVHKGPTRNPTARFRMGYGITATEIALTDPPAGMHWRSLPLRNAA